MNNYIVQYNTIQYNKQFILCQISDKIVTQRCITSLIIHHIWIYTLYAFVNMYVFNLFLNTAREWAVFMVTGRALQSMGAAFWNDLSPAYFSDVRGTCNRCWSLHLDCLGTIIWNRSWVWYNGAMLWRDLYVKHNTLNSICSCMGNQWSWHRDVIVGTNIVTRRTNKASSIFMY